jgi:D-alanyl-D-alanine dipeptidase
VLYLKKILLCNYSILTLLTVLAACNSDNSSLSSDHRSNAWGRGVDSAFTKILDSVRVEHDTLSDSLRAMGLVNINELDTGIQVDLKYAGTDNFLKKNFYGNFKSCYLQPDVAQRLLKAQQLLRKKYPFYSLIVYDGARPLHIQKLMWDALKMPVQSKQQYLSSPETKSLHNYGTAVDLSIIARDGNVLDMGTPYDYFGAIAHPEFEDRFLNEGKLSLHQIMNRELLRDIMQEAGFRKIETEWWHFNTCSRAEAESRYRIIP